MKLETELETLIRNFRTNHNMSDENKQFAIGGKPIEIRSVGRRILITAKLMTSTNPPMSHKGWLKLLELMLANQARFAQSIGSDNADSITLWRLIADEPSQGVFDLEIEQFALAIKYWSGKLTRLAKW